MSTEISDDFHFEPEPGLPAALPVGERIVWQGAPRWQDLARQAYHIEWIAGYFAVLVIVRFVFAVRGGQPWGTALLSFGTLTIAAAVAVAVLAGIAYYAARTTLYTLTTKRVVIRFGIALPVTINLPFAAMAAADLAQRENTIGDISISPAANTRVAYLLLWPHVRAWHVNRPQPTLRCIAHAGEVAQLLGEQLRQSAAREDVAVVRVSRAASASPGIVPAYAALTAAE